MIRDKQKNPVEEFGRLLYWYGIPYLETILYSEPVVNARSKLITEQFQDFPIPYSHDENQYLTNMISHYADNILRYMLRSNAIKICPVCGAFEYTYRTLKINEQYVCAYTCRDS